MYIKGTKLIVHTYWEGDWVWGLGVSGVFRYCNSNLLILYWLVPCSGWFLDVCVCVCNVYVGEYTVLDC